MPIGGGCVMICDWVDSSLSKLIRKWNSNLQPWWNLQFTALGSDDDESIVRET